jgi:hypothetical protein
MVGDDLTAIIPPGVDHDMARAMWIQAGNRRTPLTQLQVVHLLSIGVKAGRAAERALQQRRANPDVDRLATVRAHLELVESHARDAVRLADSLLNEGPTP